MILTTVLAGAGAATAAWGLNRLALRLFGPMVIIFLVPLVEEAAKTGFALMFNAHLIMVHGIFGLVEGVYDLFYAQKTGFGAGVASVAGHLLYGLVTDWASSRSGQAAIGITGGYLMHMLWNLIVMRFLVQKKRSVKP